MSKNLLTAASKQDALYRAWQHTRRSGLVSRADHIKNKFIEFEQSLPTEVRRIQRELRKGNYHFGPAIGVAKSKKPKKGHRPLVIAQNVPDRIVPRSLYKGVCSVAAVRAYVRNPYSFGGVESEVGDVRGVEAAVRRACEAVKDGAGYHIRSDIAHFYNDIPRQEVPSQLLNLLPDSSLSDLLDAATFQEIENACILEEYPDLFPTEKQGVAQGNCFSTLLGNILGGV